MNQRILELNTSNLIYEIDDDDKIQIQFQNEDILQICYSKLVYHSKYVRNKYVYSKAKQCIQREIDQIKENYKISDECLKLFINLIQNEKVNIPFEYYKDFYTLSKYFDTVKITRLLDQILEEDFLKDLDFSIQILIDSNSCIDSNDSAFSIKIENFLSMHINECLKIQNFSNLPISTVFRIIEKCDIEKVDINSLVDFILESAADRYILLKFVEFDKLPEEKIDKFFQIFELQKSEVKKINKEFMSINLSLITQMRESLKQTKQELDEARKEIERMKSQHDQETSQMNDKIEELKREKLSDNEKLNALYDTIEKLKKENDEKIKNLPIYIGKESLKYIKYGDIKKCPNCATPTILVEGGCNNIGCSCGVAWCYKCQTLFRENDFFQNRSDCYSHLKSVHGGYYD